MEKDSTKLYRSGALAYIYDPLMRHVLLVQLNHYQDDEWNFPGGGSESNETAEQTVAREVEEELGLTSNDYLLVAQASKPVVYDFPPELASSGSRRAQQFRGQRKEQFLIHYNSATGSLSVDPSEIRRYMWCPLIELEKYLTFPGQYESASDALSEFGIL